MRKSLLFLLTLLFLPVPVLAQITSLNVTVQPDGHGGWREMIENHSASSTVAMRTTFRQRTGNTSIVVAWDSVTNYGTTPRIPTGGVGYLFAQDPSKFSGGVDTVIFSDGHSEGDPQGVNQIYERRRADYKAVAQVLPLLDKIVNQEASPTEVADTIHRFPIPNDQTISQGEREGLQQVYMGVESLLRRQGDITGLYDPTKYPPDQRIEEVTKDKGIPREQAHAIVIRQKYRRFEAFLRDNLEPPVAQ
jgi:hypothetical protein